MVGKVVSRRIELGGHLDFHYNSRVHRSVKTVMRVKESSLLHRAKPVLLETLQKVPSIMEVQLAEQARHADDGVDLVAEVRTKGIDEPISRTLVVEVKSNGQPRWARIAADQLSRYIRNTAGPKEGQPYGVFIAPYVSESAAEILREHGIGFLDLAGNGRLAFDGIYIERKGNPNRFSERSELRTLFSPKASRVLRVLLMHPHTPWRMASLSEEAEVSIGLVAKVKPLLLDREWAKDTDAGLELSDPGSALDSWSSEFQRKRAHVHDYYGFGSVYEIEQRLASAAEAAGVEYALAEFSGADRFAPHVRYSRAAAYLESDTLEEVAHKAELRKVESGPNVRLFDPYDEGVFFGSEKMGGVNVAHPIQLYLDLKKTRARGEEAADHLRRHVLEKAWMDATP